MILLSTNFCKVSRRCPTFSCLTDVFHSGNIPPNSVLVFDVHLQKVERPGDGVESLDEKFENNGGVSAENKLVVSVSINLVQLKVNVAT